MKKLTTKQLATISDYIQKKGFTCIDVQMEILDHVASIVEEKLDENPGMELEKALKETHAAFGISGFSEIEAAIVKGLQKKYRHFFWKAFAIYFSPKYILLVLLSIFSLYKIQLFVGDQNYIYTGFIVFLSILAILLIIARWKDYELKRYMSYKISVNFISLSGSFLISLNLLINKTSDLYIYGIHRNFMLTSFLLTLFAIYMLSAFRTMQFGRAESEKIKSIYGQ